MSLGGPPLKMRLKKSCRSAGFVGPVACSEGVLKGSVEKFKDLLGESLKLNDTVYCCLINVM